MAYNSPLCETITTSKYTKSHVDLLAEDSGTPTTPTTRTMSSSEGSSCSDLSSEGEELLDQTMAYTGGNETRDGGQTPGPYEEMRRRMAGMHASTPISLSPTSGGIRKQRGGLGANGKKREKKRRWVWTIGKDAEDAELDEICGSPVVPWTARPELANAVAERRAEAVVGVPVLAVPMPPKCRGPRTRAQTQAQQGSSPLGQGQSGQTSVAAVGVAGNKAAAAAATVALQLQIPKLPVPVPGPPTARRLLRPALSLPSMSLPVVSAVPSVSAPTPVATVAPALPLVRQQTQQQSPPQQQQHQQPSSQQHQQQQQQQHQAERATLTPEPTLPPHGQQQQQQPQQHTTVPNTPSMESVTSMTSSILSQDSVFDTSFSDMCYNGDVEMSDASSVYSAGDNESSFGGADADGEDARDSDSIYKNYLKACNGNNFNFNGSVVGGSGDKPCHSSDVDTEMDMDMDMDTPTVGGRPGYAVERLGLGIC